MGLKNLQPIPTGWMGYLPDGRVVNVRNTSSTKAKYPTLEIFDPKRNCRIKIRYVRL